jgi:hypothetical protein
MISRLPAELVFRGRTLLGSRRLAGRCAGSGTCDFNGWQLEQGDRDRAQYHLNWFAALAGTDSEEYRSLAAALEKPPGTGLVYSSVR